MPDAALDPIATFDHRLDELEGRVGQADVPLGLAALRAYLEAGAPQGRGLRRLTAKLRPVDEVGTALAYLFVIVVDGATHEGRLAPLQAYAASDGVLAGPAGELLGVLDSDAFRSQVGWRPTRPGDRKA